MVFIIQDKKRKNKRINISTPFTALFFIMSLYVHHVLSLKNPETLLLIEIKTSIQQNIYLNNF